MMSSHLPRPTGAWKQCLQTWSGLSGMVSGCGAIRQCSWWQSRKPWWCTRYGPREAFWSGGSFSLPPELESMSEAQFTETQGCQSDDSAQLVEGSHVIEAAPASDSFEGEAIAPRQVWNEMVASSFAQFRQTSTAIISLGDRCDGRHFQCATGSPSTMTWACGAASSSRTRSGDGLTGQAGALLARQCEVHTCS